MITLPPRPQPSDVVPGAVSVAGFSQARISVYNAMRGEYRDIEAASYREQQKEKAALRLRIQDSRHRPRTRLVASCLRRDEETEAL